MSFYKYTSQELDFLREHCCLPRKELAARFNAAFNHNKSQDAIMQVCLGRGWLTGRTGCFEKGIEVWNKGLKGFCAEGSEKGWFKKGSEPPRTRPVYSQRISKDGYIEIKMPNCRQWQHKQRVVWREHFGEIPKSHIIAFKDGDKTNCDIENLEMITRGLHLVLIKNGYYNKPAALKPAIRAFYELQTQVNRLQRDNDGKKQKLHNRATRMVEAGA